MLLTKLVQNTKQFLLCKYNLSMNEGLFKSNKPINATLLKYVQSLKHKIKKKTKQTNMLYYKVIYI